MTASELPPLRAPLADDGGPLDALIKAKTPPPLDNSIPGMMLAPRIPFARQLASSDPPNEFVLLVKYLETTNASSLWSGTTIMAASYLDEVERLALGVLVLLSAWNTSDGLQEPLGIALRLTAAETFNVGTPGRDRLERHSPEEHMEEARQIASSHRSALDWFLLCQYKCTQSLLGSGQHYVAFRGGRFEEDVLRCGDPVLGPLCSFSTTFESASSFAKPGGYTTRDARPGTAGCLIVADVPTERILSTSVTGLSSSGESEIVVIGPQDGVDRAWIVPAYDESDDFSDVWQRIADS